MTKLTELFCLAIQIKTKTQGKDELYWIGYTYWCWYFLTGDSSKKIYAKANAKIMKNGYAGLHAIDTELAIEDLIRISK